MNRIARNVTRAVATLLLFASPAHLFAQGDCLTNPADPNVSYPSSGVQLLGNVSLQQFDDVRASDLWAYVSPTGREYAVIGLHNGFAFVEVTNPANPVIVEQIPGPTSCWRDVKIFGHYAYGVVDATGLGMEVFDLSQIDDGVVTLANLSNFSNFFSSHNLALNPDSGYAYLAIPNINAGVGITALDLTDPLNPAEAGFWFHDLTVRTHDAYVVNYTEGKYAGREVAFIFSEGSGVWIVDVTDKKNMFTLASANYPNVTYCHQGWLSDDRRYLFVDDELDEQEVASVTTTQTYVFNVEDLENPQYLFSFTTGLPSSDHNLMVRGRYLFEANYASGLHVFDISDIDNVHEVGFFDTYPENDTVGAGPVGTGAWGVYTMLPSRNILVSDRNRGLFVFTADPIECGDGTLQPQEICDTAIEPGQPGACPTECPPSDACTITNLLDPGTCQARCDVTIIDSPINDDGCCPDGANANNDNDCPPVCENGVCEPTEDPFNCLADCPCTQREHCDDGDICTFDRCNDGVCVNQPGPHGDVASSGGACGPDGEVNIFDIFAVLDCFQGSFSNGCEIVDVNIAGSQNRCTPEPAETCDIFDIFVVLDAFVKIDLCCAGRPSGRPALR